jgi:hypothetical protein
MGMKIFLEGEKGDQIDNISDVHRLLLRLIKESDVSNTCCLRFIDPYGHTVFNRLQMPQLLLELGELHRFANRPDQNKLLSEVEDLAQQCAKEVHLYIKIYGD